MKLSFVGKKTDEILFRSLYETYYAPFCLYARKFIEDAYVREDIVSDVFAQLWNKRREIQLNPDTAVGYLKMCVRNSCLNYLKHQEYVVNYAEHCRKQDLSFSSSSPDPDAVYTLDELYRKLYEALEKLPENYRLVFMRSFFEGKTHREIAEEMELSVKSVDRYKLKTMELLRNELKDYLPFIALLLAQGWTD